MDVWAKIAVFIPFSELIDTFWTLRRAGALPLTYTTPSNALLQFCSEWHYEETEIVHVLDQGVLNTLNEMGFPDDEIRRASDLCNGRLEPMLEYLIHSIGEDLDEHME